MMNKLKKFFKHAVELGKSTITGIGDDRIMKLSAALAYYTLFAITPLILVLVSGLSLFFAKDAIQGKLFSQITQYVGSSTALQVENFVKSASLTGKTRFSLLVGIVTLLFGASAIFVEIQDSINFIWKVKAKPKKGWLKIVQNRLLSFSLIASLGFLLLVSLVVNSLLATFSHFLSDYITLFKNGEDYVLFLVSNLITLVVVGSIFLIIYKVLPDVIISWKSAVVGATFTAILFAIGSFAIGKYLSIANPGSAYGAAGSIIVLLLWIYYTAVILYIGAEFTLAYADRFDVGLKPTKYAVALKTVVMEREYGKSVFEKTETRAVDFADVKEAPANEGAGRTMGERESKTAGEVEELEKVPEPTIHLKR